MDIMELGAIGELVGGVAVIASLLYVGLQVRQSNRQTRQVAAREVAIQFDRFLETLVTQPKARQMWILATGGAERGPMANPTGLDADDLAVFGLMLYRVFQQFHSHYRAWREGTLDDRQWAKVLPFIHFHLTSEGSLDYWQWARQGWFDEDFVSFIDEEIVRLESAEA